MAKHLVIHFARFGPYHFTRLRSAAEVLVPQGWRVTGLQTAGTDETYAWDGTGLDARTLTTVFPDRVYEKIPRRDLRRGIAAALDDLKPDAVAIAGWGTADARSALRWCRRNGVKAIVMSETRASDGDRSWWKEWIKARLVRRFDGALVGGRAHRDYLLQLGMPAERIETGYDVVDNDYFAAKAAEVRKEWSVKGEETARPKVVVKSDEARVADEEAREQMPDVGAERSETDWSATTAAQRDRRVASGGEGLKGPKDQGTSRPEVAVNGEEWRVAGDDQRSEVNRSEAQIGCKETKGQRAESGGRRSESGDRRAEVGDQRAESGDWRSEGGGSMEPGAYFLVSSRFIERKNLHRLIDAYAEYKRSFQCSVGSFQSEKEQRKPWDLVLLGDGDGKEDLERYVKDAGIQGVRFPGFQQIDSLPRWYAGAGAFVHPAFEEPWGLVINEAMASGLPVICSRTTGASELVEDGENGFLFDAQDVSALTELLVRVADAKAEERERWGTRSVELVNERAPVQDFGRGMKKLLTQR